MRMKILIDAECSEYARCTVHPNCASCFEKMLANCDKDRLYNLKALVLQPGDTVEIFRHTLKPPERMKIKEEEINVSRN